jgi:hypothetical protein
VDADDWGEWTSSDPGVAEYHYTKEVGRLAAPALYRTVVRFRWVDAAGELVARRRAVSPRCRQPDLRPDVEIADIEVDGGNYLVHVRNTGPTRAAASELELIVDGDQRRVVAVPAIKASSTRAIALVAPRCTPGGPGVSALADFSDAVDERDETDNGFARNCPLLRH